MTPQQVKLNPDQTQQLLDAGANIVQLRALLASAERAGLPVADMRAKVETAEKLRNGLLTEFGPRAS